MKNLKRVLFSFLIAIILIPQITFASWWNPFSWKMFNRKADTPTSISSVNENKELNTAKPTDNSSEEIEKLKKQIEDLQNKQINTPTKSIEVKKTTPLVDNSELIRKQVQEQLEAKLKADKEQEALTISQAQEKADNPNFQVLYARQTIFENPSHGGFDIKVRVTADKEKIYVPKTTTDSTKEMITGFSYSVKGDAFRGRQSSDVECSTYRTIRNTEYCSIEIGKSLDITTTVWLTPNESGTYGLLFENINYLHGDNYFTGVFNMNKETQKIYVKK